MKTTVATGIIVLVGLVTNTTVSAQDFLGVRVNVGNNGAGVASAADQGYANRVVNNGTSVIYDHASTVEQGWQDGYANVVRSMGDYNYNTSLAAINTETARSKYFDNRMKYAQTYFDMRRYNREAVAYERGPRPTAEDFARYAKEAAPDRLSSFEYEPALGRVFWPSILQSPVFSTERDVIDNLMALRTTRDSGLGSGNHQQINQVVVQMQARLKQNIDTLSPAEYMKAKNFLTSLQYESQIPPRPTGLAIK